MRKVIYFLFFSLTLMTSCKEKSENKMSADEITLSDEKILGIWQSDELNSEHNKPQSTYKITKRGEQILVQSIWYDGDNNYDLSEQNYTGEFKNGILKFGEGYFTNTIIFDSNFQTFKNHNMTYRKVK